MCYISLSSGLRNIDDHLRNPNKGGRYHLAGQSTNGSGDDDGRGGGGGEEGGRRTENHDA